jgi:predicted MFS family arabinose efflux permease
MRERAESRGGRRPRLVTRPLLLVFAASLGGLANFFVLLTVVPLYAARSAGDVGAGLATAALMLTTVVAEVASPRLVAAVGARGSIVIGLALLGLPALLLVPSSALWLILVVCLLRGFGFGIVAVLGSALVADIVPPERRGEGLGLYGILVSAPSIVALPLSVWLIERVDFQPLFVLATILALVSIVPALALPRTDPGEEPPTGFRDALRRAGIAAPALAFGIVAMAAGIVVTFLPLAVTSGSGSLAATALFVQAIASAFTRWLAGRVGDRHGSGRLLLPGALGVIGGIGLLALGDQPAAVLGGMLLFGAGFGFAQNASLAVMFEHVPRSGYSAASAAWNFAYDVGIGVGAAAFGVLADGTSYTLAFAVAAAVMLSALLPAARTTGGRAGATG